MKNIQVIEHQGYFAIIIVDSDGISVSVNLSLEEIEDLEGQIFNETRGYRDSLQEAKG